MQNFLLFFFGILLILTVSCRRASTEYITIALPESFSTFDTLTSTANDSAAERVRNLVFSSLVKKNENFEYIGELASEIRTSDDGKTVTFILRDGVKFHNGKDFSSADVKYTFDKLFESKGFKSGAFFDTVPVDQTSANTNSAPSVDAKKPAAGEMPAKTKRNRFRILSRSKRPIQKRSCSRSNAQRWRTNYYRIWLRSYHSRRNC